MADLRTIIKGLELRHPILPGPGPGVAGADEARAALSGGAAAVVLQTVTVSPFGDATRAPYGKDGALHHDSPTSVPFGRWLERDFAPALAAARTAGVPCIPSIGYRPADVALMGHTLADAGADALIYDTAHAERGEIAEALSRVPSGIPVFVKLGPQHGEDLADLAATLEPLVAGFITIGALGPVLAVDSENPAGSFGIGFLSGAPVRPITQRFVFELARRVRKPVIAAGGITSGADAIECLMLGASAVMVSTAAVQQGPGVYGSIVDQLSTWLDAHGHRHVGEIYRQYIRKYGHGQRVVLEKEECPELLPDACIKCTFCETVCFYDAIKAPPKTLPTITYDPCFQCGLCVSACPTDALTFRPRDQVTLLAGGEGA